MPVIPTNWPRTFNSIGIGAFSFLLLMWGFDVIGKFSSDPFKYLESYWNAVVNANLPVTIVWIFLFYLVGEVLSQLVSFTTGLQTRADIVTIGLKDLEPTNSIRLLAERCISIAELTLNVGILISAWVLILAASYLVEPSISNFGSAGVNVLMSITTFFGARRFSMYQITRATNLQKEP